MQFVMNIKRTTSKEKAIGEILPKVYKSLGLEEKMGYVFLASSWKKIVGNVIAKHTKPVGVKRQCLLVEVDSPVWMNELNNFSKKDILKRVRGLTPGIRDIRFKIGTF